MKVTKEQSEKHHIAILESASRLFRDRGFDGPNVSEIMIGAGLTHGAFYGHFGSKAELAVAACEYAFDKRLSDWLDDVSLTEFLDRYVSPSHRDRRGGGCPMTAFAPNIDQQDKALQKQYFKGVSRYIDRIRGRLELTGVDPKNAKRQAIEILATMVGGVVLARGAKVDRDLSSDILTSTRASIKARFSV